MAMSNLPAEKSSDNEAQVVMTNTGRTPMVLAKSLAMATSAPSRGRRAF